VVLNRARIARLPEILPETEFYLPPLEVIAAAKPSWWRRPNT